jgi:protein-disulfide isomerase
MNSNPSATNPLARRLGQSWQLLLALLGCALFCPLATAAQGVQLITAEGQKAILANPGTDAVGAASADLMVVEYFDYTCPYCRKIEPDLQRLLTEDGKIALVYKDWPILSDLAVYAAKAALAARWQGKYRIAHDALMSGPKPISEADVDHALERAGINLKRLKLDGSHHAAEIETMLERNDAEAHALGIRGTPGIVVGRLLLPGVTSLDGLKQLAVEARRPLPP